MCGPVHATPTIIGSAAVADTAHAYIAENVGHFLISAFTYVSGRTCTTRLVDFQHLAQNIRDGKVFFGRVIRDENGHFDNVQLGGV